MQTSHHFTSHGSQHVGDANYYVNNIDVNDENELLGEYPDDDYQDDEDEELFDSDGEALPSPEQIRDIINAIPSYKFEEKGKISNSDN